MRFLSLAALALCACAHTQTPAVADTVFRGALVIDGTGAEPVVRDLIVRGDRIHGTASPGATVIDVSGKVIMPMMIDLHTHVGLLTGTSTASDHYGRANVERHLVRFSDYGVQAVLALGSDRAEVYELREESRKGMLQGAELYTAGLGFGVPSGLPPQEMGFDQVHRPASVEEAKAAVHAAAASRPDVVKIWVDDFWGKYPKMKPEIQRAIIEQAHADGLRVAAHVYHLDDARALVAAGVDILAHSIRDAPVDEALAKAMVERGVVYVPTLSIDEFAFAYSEPPAWLHDPFFTAACEPGLIEMVTSPAYLEKLRANPVTRIERDAFATALANTKRLFEAGVLIGLGTDAGANPVRVMGFSEHHELANLVAAGLTPLQAITAATGNGAKVLRIDARAGTLVAGKEASFIVLGANPLVRVENTQSIEAIYQRGMAIKLLASPAAR